MALTLTAGCRRLAASAVRLTTVVQRFYASGDAEGVNVPKMLWKLGKLNHIAIATPDLKKSSALFRDVMGAEVSEPQALPDHGVHTVFVNLGNTKLELLHPLGEDSPITNFLKKHPSGGMHHICIEVDNIGEAMAALQRSNVRCLYERPRTGAHGKPVVFLHPKDCAGVLVELEEA